MNRIYNLKQIKKYLRPSAFICVLFLLGFSLAGGQDLPKEIRGYKVYQTKVSVVTPTEKTAAKDQSEMFVKVGEPRLVDVSLTRIAFELSAEINSSAQTGTVDFIAFHDFRVNGLTVEVEEYRESFEFRKNRSIDLSKPLKIFISAGQALHGALNETEKSKDEWTVTGRIFVFGRFKKSFFKFKRVVPIEINLKIKNPLKQLSVIGQQLSHSLTDNC